MSDNVPTVNRMVVMVSPKDPYREWARSLDDEEPTIDMMPHEQLASAYLIEYDDEPERSLKRHWDWIFQEKLNSWCRLPKKWPRRRTYRKFREWFEVQILDLVYDLADEPIFQEY